MTHGDGPKGVLMLRPDGTPMTKREVIKRRRGAFKWLPVLCSNDLVHGSWWFVWGSICTAVFAIVPLIQNYESFYHQHDDLLPQADFEATWGLLIFSGIMYAIGSLAFVRAFEEPPKVALFHWFRHFQTDELLGAWFFLIGTLPAIPYSFLYFITRPSATYFGMLAGAVIFNVGTGLFVVACYPSDKKGGPKKNYALPCCIWMVGARLWIVKHLANDWLAGTWFFLWANVIVTIGSLFLLFISLVVASAEQTFIWLSGSAASILFLIGSLYFVSGSYPHATQFYYAVDRGQTDTLTYKPPANLPDYSRPDDADPSLLEDIFFIGKARDRNAGFVVTPGHDLESTQSDAMGDRLQDAVNPLHDAHAQARSGSTRSDVDIYDSNGHIAAAGGGPSTTAGTAAATSSSSSGSSSVNQRSSATEPVAMGLGVRKDMSMGLGLKPSVSSTALASSAGVIVNTGLTTVTSPSKSGSGKSEHRKTDSSDSVSGLLLQSSESNAQLNTMRERLNMLLTADEDENRDDDDDDVDESQPSHSAKSSGRLPVSVDQGSRGSSLKQDDDIDED